MPMTMQDINDFLDSIPNDVHSDVDMSTNEEKDNNSFARIIHADMPFEKKKEEFVRLLTSGGDSRKLLKEFEACLAYVESENERKEKEIKVLVEEADSQKPDTSVIEAFKKEAEETVARIKEINKANGTTGFKHPDAEREFLFLTASGNETYQTFKAVCNSAAEDFATLGKMIDDVLAVYDLMPKVPAALRNSCDVATLQCMETRDKAAENGKNFIKKIFTRSAKTQKDMAKRIAVLDDCAKEAVALGTGVAGYSSRMQAAKSSNDQQIPNINASLDPAYDEIMCIQDSVHSDIMRTPLALSREVQDAIAALDKNFGLARLQDPGYRKG